MPADRFLHPKCGRSQKVTGLPSDEYRVWTQYILSADDFGVMRYSGVTLQEGNDFLNGKPVKKVQGWLVNVVAAGLLSTFEHQGRSYVFQWDWQTWQKIAYPSGTLNPMPPPDALAVCDEDTRRLFELHPGGKGQRFQKRLAASPGPSQDRPEISQDDPGMVSGSPARARTREVANGLRLMANGPLEESPRETTFVATVPDGGLDRFMAAYPAQGRCSGYMVETALCEALTRLHPHGLDALIARVWTHTQSHQWRVKKMIPRADKYLREGLYLQDLPEHLEQVSESTNITLSAAAQIMREGQR